ncbi:MULTISPECIES: hypothetical protein [Rhizobium/Agrobacterium group]|uniref:hypothetical protein n=1 Tax=Rhizobium/Agrobacterium group TaxID=227290 RepID=UPI000B6DF669|nr:MULTISPECIES: hypothetical protein [Rhizobium/Agrobacterium group]NSZ45505.1 hypothetical protein [Agrobacterium vitis]NTA29280.1 hypothetical protein [Allorhizobium ampelinum]OVE89410.1 hypothetical protein B7W85_22600 [Allorhizobium ampelinum]
MKIFRHSTTRYIFLAFALGSSWPVGGHAMGRNPDEVVGNQLSQYRRVLLTYFKAFNLLPIVLPADQVPGDVFDMGQKGVLVSKADECFPGLKQPEPVQSVLAYTFELDTQKAGLALGIPKIGSVDLGGDFEQTITVNYTDVKVRTVSQQSLRTTASDKCPDILAIARQKEVALTDGSKPALLAIVGTVVTAKREIFIGAKTSIDMKVAADKLSTLLTGTGAGMALKVSGLDPSLSAVLGFGGKSGLLVQSNMELPVAFMPAFIPEVLFASTQGDQKPTPRALKWDDYDPNAEQNKQLLRSLIDGAANK